MCDFAGFLQIVVDAIDQLVNDCSECEDPDAPKSTFTLLETKLRTLLQDTVGGTPSVDFVPSSDEIRSSLELDLTMQWTFQEATQLNIDLASILEGMDLDEDLLNIVKGIIAVEGQGRIEVSGSLSFTLGIGLEYEKATETIIPYFKGITGITVTFSTYANAIFQASIGPLTASVDLRGEIDNYGEPLSISIGLDPDTNYYISSNRSLTRNGFQRVQNVGALGDEMEVAISGRVEAKIDASLFGDLGKASLTIQISDINNLIQGKSGAVAIYYEVSRIQIPSLLDILLLDPFSIVSTVDMLFKTVNDMTLGRKGIVTNFRELDLLIFDVTTSCFVLTPLWLPNSRAYYWKYHCQRVPSWLK